MNGWFFDPVLGVLFLLSYCLSILDVIVLFYLIILYFLPCLVVIEEACSFLMRDIMEIDPNMRQYGKKPERVDRGRGNCNHNISMRKESILIKGKNEKKNFFSLPPPTEAVNTQKRVS